MDADVPRSWTNQRWRTRTAIVEAAREQALTGAEITMAAVAKLALVSEATAYRYFPDLVSLLREVLEDTWPEPAEAMKPVAGSTERPDVAGKSRPGHRFGLIDHALAPLDQDPAIAASGGLTQLKQDLAIIVSAEALFVLTDLCGLSPNEAIASVARTARTVTQAAINGIRG